MNTNFSEQLWIDFDLEVEYFLRFLVTWITHNSQKDNADLRNFHEDKYWSYNSYPEYTKMLPGFSIQNLRTIVNRCVKNDLIIIGNFNRKKYDNTNWYTLTEKGWSYFDKEARKVYPERFAQSGRPDEDLNTPVSSNRPPVSSNRPIPKELNSLRENTTTSSSNSKSKEKNLNFMREMIDVYREIFPNNPQPHAKLISTTLLKTLQTLIKRWPEADPNGKPMDIVAFRNYLEYLKLTSPQFALGEYETANGKRKKNSLETFARWNTLVKCLEGAYS